MLDKNTNIMLTEIISDVLSMVKNERYKDIVECLKRTLESVRNNELDFDIKKTSYLSLSLGKNVYAQEKVRYEDISAGYAASCCFAVQTILLNQDALEMYHDNLPMSDNIFECLMGSYRKCISFHVRSLNIKE